MIENPNPNEAPMADKKPSKFPRWLWVAIPGGLLGLCCLVLVLVIPSILKINVKGGGYSIESVTLSTGLENGQPVGIKEVFMPSDTINCTVKTSGWDEGIIGMRWYLGENKIFETTGKTKDNIISTYIKSNNAVVLPEGKYRVEIFMTQSALETVYFEVKIYHPTVNPPVTIPEGHRKIEVPWFPEVPFAFDEVWKIGETEWVINEVKVILMEDTREYFVAVVVDTDQSDILSLSESAAKERTRPIAMYAIENGYVERAKSLEIDGKHYDLDQILFVILKNPSNQQGYRVKFMMDELRSTNSQ